MKLRLILIHIFILVTCTGKSFCQEIDENWAPVLFNNNLVYIDLNGIDTFRGEEIYVWTIEKHNPPIEIESVDNDIYKTKTYYVIDKKLKKYSLLEVIYYDKKNNVLKDFTYKNPAEDPQYKYSYPIFNGSLLDLILKRIERELESKTNG